MSVVVPETTVPWQRELQTPPSSTPPAREVFPYSGEGVRRALLEKWILRGHSNILGLCGGSHHTFAKMEPLLRAECDATCLKALDPPRSLKSRRFSGQTRNP